MSQEARRAAQPARIPDLREKLRYLYKIRIAAFLKAKLG